MQRKYDFDPALSSYSERNYRRIKARVPVVVDGSVSHQSISHHAFEVAAVSEGDCLFNVFDAEGIPPYTIGNPVGENCIMQLTWLQQQDEISQGLSAEERNDVCVLRIFCFGPEFSGRFVAANVELLHIVDDTADENQPDYLVMIFRPAGEGVVGTRELKLTSYNELSEIQKGAVLVPGTNRYVRVKPIPKEHQR